jgi:sigma-E factor negative regulatory protein RseC
MNNSEAICHEGKVTKVNSDGVIEVTITSGSACSGCHAKSACGMGSETQKVISVRTTKSYNPGEKVTVMMEQWQGVRAVVIGYVLPFVVLIAVFIGLTVGGAGELLSALVSFASLGIYYLTVWLLRVKINKNFTFKIKN